MKKIYTITMKTGEKVKFSADFSDADSAVMAVKDRGQEFPTRLRVGKGLSTMEQVAPSIVKNMGYAFWLFGASVARTYAVDGTPLYNGVTALEYIESLIDSVA